jgi:nicotinamide-nucleotide amidase
LLNLKEEKMRAELLSIGDELLIGQTINTNASWLGQECSKIGIQIVQVTTISDEKQLIKEAIDLAFLRSDIVLVTGGLGPTKDDITKYTLCEYFDSELEIHLPTLTKIETYFAERKRPMLEVNIRQAELPKKCEILENRYGTAAGMWFTQNDKVLISMPGVPYEMKGIMLEEVFPRLKERFVLKAMYHKTILTQGIGESFLAEAIKDWENEVREAGLGLAYLPSPGMVKLRLSSYQGEVRKEEINAYFTVLEDRFPQYIYGSEEDTLPSVIGKLLIAKELTIGTVESCTAGALAKSIVSVAGSSSYFEGSILTYSNALKKKLVHVSTENLDNFGAVSQEVVEQMAVNGREILGVDMCISTSGVAGPDGGSDEKPVGTIWIAIASNENVFSKQFYFGNSRERNIEMTVLTALNLARCKILGILSEKN